MVLGPRFAKVVADGLYGGVVADGREWKYGGRGEDLARELRADDLAVELHQAAVGLVGEQRLRGARHGERVQDPEEER